MFYLPNTASASYVYKSIGFCCDNVALDFAALFFTTIGIAVLKTRVIYVAETINEEQANS